jgi:hypothetical protein
MAPITRFSWWAVGDGDVVIAARTTDHRSTEFLRVIAMDFMHLAPARPLGLDPDLREPRFFWQYGMRDGEAGGESAGFLQIDGETEHHATIHINDHGQRWPLDRLPMLLIDHNDVHGRMVNLGDS